MLPTVIFIKHVCDRSIYVRSGEKCGFNKSRRLAVKERRSGGEKYYRGRITELDNLNMLVGRRECGTQVSRQ